MEVSLYIIHLNNAEVSIRTAAAIRKIHRRLHGAIHDYCRSRAALMIDYVIESMEKEKMWFKNYKSHQQASVLTVVSILVAQQDAAFHKQLNLSMKQDSTSVKAIAVLPLLFLPGTFTSVSTYLPPCVKLNEFKEKTHFLAGYIRA